MTVTLIIPTIRGREGLLTRALDSVRTQALRPDRLIVEHDPDRAGAVATRNRALAKVDTEYVAFLDDDDVLLPHHLKTCVRHMVLTDADLVYPWFEGEDESEMFGVTFDPMLLRRRNYIPVTVVTRTELVRKVGGFEAHPDERGDPCEDWGLWLKLLDAGARFSHLPQRTWVRAPGGTRGRPEVAHGPG